MQLKRINNLLLIVLHLIAAASAQEQQATIRVDVTSASMPIADAVVTINDLSLRTNDTGIATTSVPLGNVRITVTKDGYFPATTTVIADSSREFVASIELQQNEEVKETVTVSATRTDWGIRGKLNAIPG